jgi:TolB-like protein/Flp pilus assembly protein TadD
MPWKCPRCHFENSDSARTCKRCSAPPDTSASLPNDPTRTLGRQGLDFKTGQLIAGRYEIVECLGEGGMGKVYKAHDLEVHEDVALKLIRPDISGDEGTIQRFRNELKLARKISHRNVCRMFDLGREGDGHFITMEYVPGEDLKTTIQRIGPLTIRKTLDVGKQICQGLSEAHGLGIIHRDLKPSNIIVDRAGNVRIMDFGIALSRESEGLTDPGAVPGTIDYLAPEVLSGKKPSSASDIYSLGIILYEMVTGRVPFQGKSAYQVAAKHMKEPPKDPVLLNPEVPPTLSRMILRCLSKDPAQRYQKAEEVCSELSRIEKGRPAAAAGPRWKRWWDSFTRKERLRRFAVVEMPLAIVAAGLVYLASERMCGRGGAAAQEQNASGWRNSIVVLPFTHLNMQEGQEHMWPTITDRIIRDLEKFPALKVINYQTALGYKDSTRSGREIAKRLGVNNILKGVITSEKDGFDVGVELDNMSSNTTSLSKAYISPTEKELYPIVDEISQAVAGKLGVLSGGPASPGVRSRDSTNPEANRYYHYGLMLRNRYLASKATSDFESSVNNFEKAIDLDPTFARVYWEMGILYEAKFIQDKRASDLAEMTRLLEEAYRQDHDLPEANVGMGWVYFNREEHDQAYRFFKRAYQLDMNSALINYHIGSFLRSLGLYGQARTHYARALDLEPDPSDFAVWHRLLADCESQMGLGEEADDVLRKAMEVNPDASLTLDDAVLMIKAGRFDEAGKLIDQAEGQMAAEHPGPEGLMEIRRHRALLYAASGHKEAAWALVRGEDPTANHTVIAVYALLGMKDKTIAGIQLGETRFDKYRWYPYSYLLLKNNPFFGSLRRDPAFKSIFQKEKDVYEERQKKFGDL